MYVKGSKKPKAPIPPDAVIKLSGQPANSMCYAILELCTPQELFAMKVAGRPRPGCSSTGAKCIRCTHARGIYFHGTSWNVAREDPTAHASMYVPTVALTRLLADPRWKSLALRLQDNAAFVAEVRRTVDRPTPGTPIPRVPA
jgi:hypothetical protein